MVWLANLDPAAWLRYGIIMRSPSNPADPDRPNGPTAAETREKRQKAALKANMARRKAQAKARTAGEPASGETEQDG